MKVYVFCHIGAKKPNGGVKILFEYARALRQGGHDAYILIPGTHLYPNDCPKGYKPSWFDTDVPVEDDVRVVTKDDIVIIHEEGIWCYEHLAVNNPRMIMINQGAQSSLTDNVGMHISYNFARNIYSKCLGVITISPYIANFVNVVFQVDNNKIHIIENPIDSYFKPAPYKSNTILVMNKQPSNVVSQMIIKIVSERYPLWNVKIAQELSHKQLAQEMADAKIFLFLCTPHGEGSSLPPVEAALSGCKVIGYSGLGSRYYYQLPLFTEIEYNDVTQFIVKLDHYTSVMTGGDSFSILFDHSIQELRGKRSIIKFDSEVNRVFNKLISC